MQKLQATSPLVFNQGQKGTAAISLLTRKQQMGSDRPWADVRDLSAYHKTQALQAQIPESPKILVQATGWRRNAQGKIEIFAHKPPTQVQPSLTCAGVGF